MHDGSINRGGRRGREQAERASQQPPTHLLLDFLPTWPIPLESAYLNSRALVKPEYARKDPPVGFQNLIPRIKIEINHFIVCQKSSFSDRALAGNGDKKRSKHPGGGFIAASCESCERDLRRVPLSLRPVPATVGPTDCLR
ncbi:Uncharacterized protein DBV15_04927 [Temnothorax longispinosus]|uniref:Uncharacterized protein n=1 Tax=Temnothorax longispinosus TaxID=300112 RepID=A0A4S2KZL3_9HYME|nr:Uncharacterized protein DBV15_04927 [Temnothorax longispinosus]